MSATNNHFGLSDKLFHFLNDQKMVKNVNQWFISLYVYILFCPQTEDVQFRGTEEESYQKILTFKMLE